MDSTDEEFYGSTSFTTKGRRTKRQRTATTTSSYGGCIEISYGSSASASASATPSPSTPDDHDIISHPATTEEEDMDMANCLILLAQGVKKTRSSKLKSNNNTNNNNTITDSSVAIGVYECKTCNRTFPSFQALGGHRTSHKKITSTPVTPKPPKLEFSQTMSSTKQSPEKSSANNRSNFEKSSSRVHECSICGSEFSSGQALGGHMRRHRPVVTPSTAVVLSGDGPIIEVGPDDMGGPRNILSLDLNLPAPSEHDDVLLVVDASNTSSHMVETKFHVIPTPALLDCHY